MKTTTLKISTLFASIAMILSSCGETQKDPEKDVSAVVDDSPHGIILKTWILP